jgi:MSHA biogenesis protein MshJ
MERSVQQITTSHPPDDPDIGNRQRLAEIQIRNAELDKRLHTLTTDFIKPSEMAPLLESLLAQAGNLKLVKMQTLAPEVSDAKNGGDGYYRRGLAVEVLGGYLDALRYLQALEDLPWEFFWDSVKIEVKKYPTSHITILVHTLGYSEGGSSVPSRSAGG